MNKFLATSQKESNLEIPIRDSVTVCDPIDSLAIGGQDETTGVTSFVQEACEKVDVLGSNYRASGLGPNQPELQDLKEYFRRPRVVLSGTFATGTRTKVFTFDINRSTLFNTFFPGGLTRLLGVTGTRFKLVFTLQVAATPFHQGVMALNWQYATANNATDYYIRANNSGSATNLPHVRLDIAQDTMCQLEIPFIATQEWFDMTGTTPQTYGLVALNTILPVAVVPSTLPPTYKLLVHLENMELFGASPDGVASVTPQAGKQLKPMNQEFETDAYPFSSSLHAFSRSVKWLGKGIPMLSSIAGPASWFLDKASGAVRAFGWSKPLIQEPQKRIYKYEGALEYNVDVPSPAIMVAPMASNQLMVSPEFSASDVDEMSFAYIKSLYSQICIGQMAVADPTNTNLYVCRLSPSAMWFRVPAGAPYGNVLAPLTSGLTANSFLPSHLFYLASTFKQWKGGFKFRFTFAKTKMHGGRVMVTFNPYTSRGTISNTIPPVSIAAAAAGSPQPFGYSAIFDLRDGNIFEFEVPYINGFPYMEFVDGYGSIAMTILDPLQAPSVVSNTIGFMVEVKATDDFEFQMPRGPIYAVHNRGTIKLQSGRILSNISADSSQMAIGEQLNSIKQLITIPKMSKTSNTDFSVKETFLVMPWYYTPNYPVLVPGVTEMLPESFGYGGYFAQAYTWVRGGTDAHLLTSGPSTDDFAVWSSTMYQARNDDSVMGSPLQGSNVNFPVAYTLSEPSSHVRFPAYQKTYRVPSVTFNSTPWGGNLDDANRNPVITSTMISTPISLGRIELVGGVDGILTTITLTRAAADDAMCGHYMGPPPLVLASANTGIYYDPDSNLLSQN